MIYLINKINIAKYAHFGGKSAKFFKIVLKTGLMFFISCVFKTTAHR